MLGLVKSPQGGLLFRNGGLFKGPAAGADCCCVDEECTCQPCILVEYIIADDGLDAPPALFVSGSVRLLLDTGDTTPNPDGGIWFTCLYLDGDQGNGIASVRALLACPAGPSGIELLSNSFIFRNSTPISPEGFFVVPDGTGTMPYVHGYPYDSGIIPLYKGANSSNPKGTVRVRTLTDCEGAH